MADVSDNIDEVVPTTDSARRVVELVRLYGKSYVAGELSLDRGMALTGSEIPTFCSENRFEDAVTCFFNKIYGKKQVDNEYTQHGRRYEPVAIAKFKQQTGAKVFFVSFMRSERYPFIAGTFDALAIMPDGEGVLVEVKCPLKRSISDKVPEQYVGQVQTYLEIAGLQTCLFVQYKTAYVTPARKWKRPEKLIVTRTSYDPSYFRVRMPVLWDFWVRICAWRCAILPTADLAARLLVAAWRVRKHKTTHLKAALAAVAFRGVRMAHKGLYEAKMLEMEESRPDICDGLNGPLVIDTQQGGCGAGSTSVRPNDKAADDVPMKLVVSVGCSAFEGGPITFPVATFMPVENKPIKLAVHVSPADSMGSMACAAAAVAAAAATHISSTSASACTSAGEDKKDPNGGNVHYPSPKKQRTAADSPPLLTPTPVVATAIAIVAAEAASADVNPDVSICDVPKIGRSVPLPTTELENPPPLVLDAAL